MYKIFNIVIVCLSLFINNLLFADSKLNEIVVTPSLRETTLFDSLSSIEIITKEEIQALGHSSVNDILSHSSSINIGSNGGHGQTKSIFLRGTESNHTKVLVNGVTLNPGTLGVASIQHISVDMIDRIEISKGSMSTLFGRDTIGGVINIITNKNSNSNIVIGTGRDETNKIGISKSISYGLHILSMNYMKYFYLYQFYLFHLFLCL
jgi:vitamin B12 transporter